MARLSRTGSRVQGFQRIAAGEVTRRQDMQEGLWFGDGPGIGMVPTADLRMAAISNRVADAINMTCFTPPLGGAGFPGTNRCIYQRVTVVRACTISLVEMGFMYPPAQPYPPVWCWAQVSIYANDGAAGGGLAATPSTLLARCVPIPLAALSTDDSIDFVLPLWEPIDVLAGTVLWVAVSPKAYHAPTEAVHTDENGAYYIDARGTRAAGILDCIKADTPEPPIGATPGNWLPYDDIHLWVRLYEHPEALALQNSIDSPPPTSRVGIRSIIKRPVEGELESAFAGGIRPGMGTLPWDLAGGSGRAGGGGGATGNVNAPLPLTAGEVVYATGANTVATDAGFTFDAGTGIAYATALQTAQNIGIPADADLVQFAVDEVTVNGVVRIGGATDTGISFHSGIGTPGFIHHIYPETVDAADDHLLAIMGGGARSDTRGAYAWLAGNEYAANSLGRLVLFAGNPGTAGTYDGHITFHTGGALSMNLLDSGNLELMPDTDAIATFGRAKIGFMGTADQAAFAHYDNFSLTDCAFRQAAAGYTVFNAKAGQIMYFRINNTDGMRMIADALYPATDSVFTLGTAAGPKYFLNVFTDTLTLFPNVTISGGGTGMVFDVPAGDSYFWKINTVAKMTLSALELSVAGTINTTDSYEVDGTKVVGNRGAAIGDLAAGAAWDPTGIAKINQIIARLKATTGHGLVAG